MAELTPELEEATDIRETVRERYAAAARAATDKPAEAGCGCGPSSCSTDVFGGGLYEDPETDAGTAAAVSASLGCGVPTGKAIGLDMTDEMLALARTNAAEAGLENVEFVKGYIEDIPLPSASVDVVISNCVINLAADKRRVLAEVGRVLRPGGRFAVSDVIADADMDEATRSDMAAWTGCIAGALTEAEFRDALSEAGLTDIEIRPAHRVHEHAGSAIVRARKPA
jgi:arsenite methyltransferase